MMTRVLIVVCAVLAALCALQWRLLAEQKRQLAPIDFRVAVAELNDRHEEVVRVVDWVDAAIESRRAETPKGVCVSGDVNRDALIRNVFDVYVYLRARHAGASEAQARQEVLEVQK